MMFCRSQQVICINDNFGWARKIYPEIHSYPVKGKRYVVRGYVCGDPHPAIVLQGIVNPQVIYQDHHMAEAGFWEKRFVAAPLPQEISDLLKGEVDA